MIRRPLLVRFTFLLLAAGFLVSLAWIPAAAASQAVTFNPIVDGYVSASNPTTNYGSAATLRVDASPVVNSYLRFNVTGLAGQTISKAQLQIYANSASPQGLVARSVSNESWSESTLTYNTAPAMGGQLAASSAVTAGTWVTLDVSAYVTADGVYSFGISTPGATAVSLAAHESGANAPRLIVTTGGSSTPVPTQPPPSGSSNILLIAGDICKHDLGAPDYTANCKKTGDLVRSILAANPGAQVQTLGDNVNNDAGSSAYDSQYRDLYAPNWGSFLNVTHALEGNHDTYPPSGTAPYFAYFGAAAGPKPGGYYSYNIGSSWHVIVLNAQCSQAGGCASGTPQYNWLQNDLAANTRKCVLAVWHQPRWTSGRHPDDSKYAPWWSLLYQYKVDIVANGHNHNYERFNLINPSEQAAADGIREFIVGTGGAPGDAYSYASHPLDPNEAVRSQKAVYGVLKLTLSNASYSWNFLTATGTSITDSGNTACH
jgi:Calcineurin-like phosphoesterase